MSSAIELTSFRAQPKPQPKKKTIFKYTFTCGDVVYSDDSKHVTHICKKVKPQVKSKPQVYLIDERYENFIRQLNEYRARGGPTLYDDFRSSFTDKDLKYILSNQV